MDKPVSEPERPQCPACGEDELIELDQAGRQFFCFVCAHTWAPKDPR